MVVDTLNPRHSPVRVGGNEPAYRTLVVPALDLLAARQAGIVYRPIPNWAGYYDDELGQPAPLAFAPLENEGLNWVWTFGNEDDAGRSLQQHKGFGLCWLDLEEVIFETAGYAKVEFYSESYIKIHGCANEYVRLTLAAIAEVLIEPAKPYEMRPAPARARTRGHVARRQPIP